MNEQHLVQSLYDIAERDVEKIDLWPAIQQRVQPRTRTTLWTRVKPTTRLGWAAFALLILVPVGVVLSSTLRDIYLQGDAALLYIEREGLNKELNLQQTVNGFTFDLRRVYADANRIVIGYTVSGDLSETIGRRFHTSLDLRDAAGNRIPGGEMTFDDEAWDGTMDAVVSFDPSEMDQLPAMLHAVVELVRMEPTSDPNQWEGQKVADASFEFAPPAAANLQRRIVDVDQTVTANGVSLTLEQVRISPTTAIATVCFNPSYKEITDWTSFGTLATELDQEDRTEKRLADAGSSTNCHRPAFYSPHFYERGGEWTLTVTELRGTDPVLFQAQEEAFAKAAAEGRVLTQAPDITRTITGPWTFTFDVPQP